MCRLPSADAGLDFMLTSVPAPAGEWGVGVQMSPHRDRGLWAGADHSEHLCRFQIVSGFGRRAPSHPVLIATPWSENGRPLRFADGETEA